MREILFRGQTRRYGEKVRMGDGHRLPSKWVYGGIFPGTGDFSVIYGSEKEDFTGADIEKYTVYSSTVGQYTGLKDKNGKRIFEGDVGESIDGRFLVHFDEVKAAFVMRFYDYPYETLLLEEMWDDAEIIGNDIDKPELLGGSNG